VNATRALSALFASSLALAGVLGGAARGAAQEAKPAPPAAWTCTQPAVPPLPDPPTARDVRDQALRVRLRELLCALDSRRRLALVGQEKCYFGPELVRIPRARYDEIQKAYKSDPVELWHALLSEPEDPNAAPITVRVVSKSGPNCDDDYERKLEDEAAAIQKELNFR
jgi:hypothetical protein